MSMPRVALGELLTPISRPERVQASGAYHLLGVRWYGEGLFVKDIKQGSDIQAKTLYRVEEGDFVYSRLFAWKGSFALATPSEHGCYVSNEFPYFRPISSLLDGRYLRLCFARESSWNEALGLSSGSTPTSRNRLKEAKLLAMTIPLPSLSEQQQIVAQVDLMAAKIEEARELRKQADAELLSLVTSLHTALSGGERYSLAEFLELFEDRQPIVPGVLYPQVGVRGFGQGLFAKAAIDSTQTTYRYFNQLFTGAIVLSQVKGWEGAIAVCPEELSGWFTSPEYRTFRCIEDRAIPDYFETLLRTPWFHEHLKSATRGLGARRERVRPENFLELAIPMPGIVKQKEAVATLKPLSLLSQLQSEVMSELQVLTPAIIDQVFQ